MSLIVAIGIPAVLLVAVASWLYTPDLDPRTLERRYASEASRFVEIDGLRVHYRDEGPRDDRAHTPLLLLHGLGASLFVWDEWTDRLKAAHRVVRLDLPGQGLTGPDPEQRYGWDAMADLVIRFMDRLGLAHAIVVGNSQGGAVAWTMAARHPERVDRLVLLAPIGYPFERGMPLVLRLLASPVTGPIVARLTPESLFLNRLRGSFGDPDRLDPKEAQRTYALFRRAGNRQALPVMLGSGPIPDPRPLLARISAPTLVVWGSADRLVPPGLGRRFVRDIADARLVLLEGVGHTPMIERPDESLALLRRFLAQDEELP